MTGKDLTYINIIRILSFHISYSPFHFSNVAMLQHHMEAAWHSGEADTVKLPGPLVSTDSWANIFGLMEEVRLLHAADAIPANSFRFLNVFWEMMVPKMFRFSGCF